MNVTPEQRHNNRQGRSILLLNDFAQWLDTHIPVVPPKSALGEAMRDADRQRSKLTTYTYDWRKRTVNNLAETAIRPVVVGRKNFLILNSVAAAKASAHVESEYAGGDISRAELLD